MYSTKLAKLNQFKAMNIDKKILLFILYSTLLSVCISLKGQSTVEVDLVEDVLEWLSGGKIVKRSSNPIISGMSPTSVKVDSLEKLLNTLTEDKGKNYQQYERIQMSYHIAKGILQMAILKQDQSNGDIKDVYCDEAKATWESIQQMSLPKRKSNDYFILKKYSGEHNLGYSKVKDIVKKGKQGWISLKLTDLDNICYRKEDIRIPEDLCDSEITKSYYKEYNYEIKEAFSQYRELEYINSFSNNLRAEIDNLSGILGSNGRGSVISSNIPLVYYIVNAMIHELLSNADSTRNCNDAQRNWYYAYQKWNEFECEVELLNKYSLSLYGSSINRDWVEERYHRTKKCAKKIYTCCADGEAVNADTIAIRLKQEGAELVPGGKIYSCCLYKGCDDEYADNYFGNVSVKDTCFYTRCLDSCYLAGYQYLNSERYRLEKENGILIQNDSLCTASSNICGCTNECSENYNPEALVDDGSCKGNICGCLDSTAVNYANDPNSIYYNPAINKHSIDSCSWAGLIDRCLNPSEYDDAKYRHHFAKESLYSKQDTICGCKDSLAINFNPDATHNDFHLCNYYSDEQVDSAFASISIKIENTATDADKLREKFEEASMDPKTRTFTREAVGFRSSSNGNGLILELTIDFEKFKQSVFSALWNGMPLGEYSSRRIATAVTSVIIFLDRQSIDNNGYGLSEFPVSGFVLGSADGHSIRKSGIIYKNRGEYVLESYELLNANGTLKQNERCNMQDGDKFYRNETLAFLRAYFVKESIKFHYKNNLYLDNIKLQATVSSEKGGAYRGVKSEIHFENFFLRAKQVKAELLNEQKRLIRMKASRNGEFKNEKELKGCECSK